MTEPSLKQGQGQYCALDLKVFVCATHDTQCTSQPAKKCEFLLQKYRGEDGGDDDGQGSKRGLGSDGVSDWRPKQDRPGKGAKLH